MKTIGSRIHRIAMTALLVLAAGGIAAAARGAEPATWKDQDLVLDYMGFTTHYSCDGLRDRVRTVLLQLGARPDLTVTSSGCTRTGGGPERFPSVRAHFATLQPAAEAAPGAAAGAWKSVNLGGHNGLDEGECELGDEIVRTVLPHFAVRNVDWHAPCVPHATSIALSLRLDVFAPPAPPQR
jgi:hypothetical protein